MSRVDPDGLRDEVAATTGRDGNFTFMAAPGPKYRIALDFGMTKTLPRIVATNIDRDIDVGDMVFEPCPAVSSSNRKPPPRSDLVRDLRPEQIIIEPQRDVDASLPVPELPPANFKPNDAVERPPCTNLADGYRTIESFVGGEVKTLRVVGYDAHLTPAQIRSEIRKVWRSVLREEPASSIIWAEGNRWNIQASIEDEDGQRSSILMDGWIHFRVQDREGRYWFGRLWPEVE